MGKGSFLSFHRIVVIALVTLGAALLIGPHTAFAVEGYWKYDGFRMEHGNEYYATVKALPGHVYEVRAYPGFQAGPGSARGALDFYFKTDDADCVQYLATSTLTFGANSQLVTLVPGQSVTFELGLTVSGNDKAGAIQAYGTGSIGIDYGDSVQVKSSFKQASSAKGDAIIPGGGPDAIMTIHVNSHLSQLGAMSDALFLSYVWVAGTPPPVGSSAPVSRFGDVLGDTLLVTELAGKATTTGRGRGGLEQMCSMPCGIVPCGTSLRLNR